MTTFMFDVIFSKFINYKYLFESGANDIIIDIF